MTLGSQEHYDLIFQFDKEFSHRRLDKEPKNMWKLGHVYQDGSANDLFLAYRRGFAFAKTVYREEIHA